MGAPVEAGHRRYGARPARTRVTGTSNDGTLKLVFFEGFQGRWAATQDVVAGDAVEDMDAVVVQQCGLRHRPFGPSAALVALFERFVGDLLNRFEAMAFSALVFVKRHVSCH